MDSNEKRRPARLSDDQNLPVSASEATTVNETDDISAVFASDKSALRNELKEVNELDESKTQLNPELIPDGGLNAWLQVLGSWVVMAVTWGLINSFGVYQTFYERELLSANSPSQISWVGSLQAAILMMLAPVSGALFDAGYFRETLWAGLLLIVAGQFATSACTTYWQVVLAQGVCFGIGCGLTFLPATVVLSQFFHRRRSLAMGVSATGSPIAGMVFPIVFSRLQPQIGFGWATRVMAFVVLGLSVVPAVFFRPRLSPPQNRRVRSAVVVDWTALREPPFVLVTTGAGITFLGMYVAFFYVQVYALHFAVAPPDFSPYFVTMLSAGSIVGRLGPPYLADKVGALNAVVAATYACAALAFAWIAARSQAGLAVFAILYGCFTGSVVSMLPSVLVGLNPDRARVGTRMGMMFAMAGVAVLVGTPVAGAILADKSDDRWLAMICYSAATLLGGAIIFSLARLARYRTNKMWNV